MVERDYQNVIDRVNALEGDRDLVVKRMIDRRRFEAIADLHEDWESPGFYLYEQFRNMEPVGPEVTQRIAEVCSINRDPVIEEETALDGVIYPNMEIEKRRGQNGMPIVLFR